MGLQNKTFERPWSIGPKVNGQQNLTGFIEFFLPVSGGSHVLW